METVFFRVSVRMLYVAKTQLVWVERDEKEFWDHCDIDNIDQML